MASNAKINDVVHSLLDGLHAMSKSETLIGDPYKLGDATIVPVHRLQIGLGVGTIEAGGKRDDASGETGARGVGGSVQVEPVAVVAVGRDGVPRFLPVGQDEAPLQEIMKELPSVVGKALRSFSDRIEPLMNKLAAKQGIELPTISETKEEAKKADGKKAELPEKGEAKTPLLTK